MRVLATVTALLALGGTANAQSLGECRAIAGDAERLACYDRLPAAGQALGPQLAPQRSPMPSDPAFAAAENAIKGELNDPGSARFIGVQRKPGAICGYVNARNAAGGYTGAKLFVYVLSTGEARLLDQPEDVPAGQTAHAVYDQHCK